MSSPPSFRRPKNECRLNNLSIETSDNDGHATLFDLERQANAYNTFSHHKRTTTTTMTKKKRSSSYSPLKITSDDFFDDGSDNGSDVDTVTTSNTKPKGMDEKDRSKNVSTIQRLMEMSKPERHLMIRAAISMTLGSGVSLAVPFFSGRIIDLSLHQRRHGDHGNDDDDEDGSPFKLLIILVIIMTLAGMAGFFRMLWQAEAGHRLVARVRRQLYRSILSQDAGYFDATPQGDLISRLSSDADLVQSAVTDQALGIMRNFVIAVGAIALLLYTSMKLSLVSMAILPPVAFAARFFGRSMKDREKSVRELHADATSMAEQTLTCIRTVQQFATEQCESERYNAAINQAHAEGIANMRLKAMFGSFMQLVMNVVMVIVLGYGGRLVQAGDLTPGDLTSFVMYSVMMGGNVSSISTQYIDLMKAIAAANRVFDIIDRSPAVPAPIIVESAKDETLTATKKYCDRIIPRDEVMKIENIDIEMRKLTDQPHRLPNNGTDQHISTHHNSQQLIPLSVEFSDVDFAYPTRPKAKVLDQLNLTIPAGKMVALVGSSGAGKSTIANLLTRLYDPQAGKIWLGKDKTIQDMHPQEVRRNVGIVSQEPLLFPTTIEENIRYGSPNASNYDVLEAARLAFVLEFAAQFPDDLQTIVGPRGTQLSGGQKQRVAIARCILKNPPIVILDESTSALDAESEYQVQKAIETACKGRTVILIAHRISTIRSADAIAVLEDGRLAEMGTFEELMNGHSDSDKPAEPGPFRRLMEKQLLINQ